MASLLSILGCRCPIRYQMAKWRRTLNKSELLEAVKDYLLKGKEIDGGDQVIVLLGSPLLVDVTTPDKENPNAV